MSDTKTKILFEFYKNIKNGTEILSVEDLEIAIQTMELAKEELKTREQKRLQKAELESLKTEQNDSSIEEKVLCITKDYKGINAREFENNREITKLIINRGITEIGEYAFAGCTNLREIVFPPNRVILRRGCFKDCSLLQEVFIPDVANICPGAFENCTSLKKVFLPADISNIYTGAFKNCRSLHTVEFEERTWGHTVIYSRVFENCISLKTIELPDTCSVDIKSFLNCHNLETVYTYTQWRYMREFEKCGAKIIKIQRTQNSASNFIKYFHKK